MDYEGWAEWYDIAYSTQSNAAVDFYVDLARRSGGPVLEIGVGTGRMAVPAARAGVDVVGVDANRPMLEAARRKLDAAGSVTGSVELLQADMRTLELGRTFPLVIAPARVLLLATAPHEQQASLNHMAAHVAPGGRLVFNIWVPDPALIADNSPTPHLFGESVNPASGRRVLMWNRNRFDTVAQINRSLQTFEELDEEGRAARTVTLEVVTRYLYPSEVHEMVAEAGLRVEAVYGDFDRSPFTEDSDEMICVCRHAD